MSFVPNPANMPLVALLPSIQRRYPGAEIKKPFLSPEIISVPVKNYKMLVRAQPKRNRLWVDFTPPVLWLILGVMLIAFVASFTLALFLPEITRAGLIGGLVGVGFFVVKAVFKSIRRTEIDAFHADVQRAMQPDDGSIF